MRVIGGAARGRRLKGPPAGVRPTSDLVRGAIFDTLEAQGAEWSRIIDIYAGSGALGIEALSRGGDWCDFVERNAASAAVIRANLAVTGLQERGAVHRIAAARATERLQGPYSLLLADPPYDDEAAETALAEIAGSELVDDGAVFVLEHSARRDAPQELGALQLYWNRRYGDTQVSMYRQRA